MIWQAVQLIRALILPFRHVKRIPLALTGDDMADDAGAEPAVTKTRKPQDQEIEASPVKDDDRKVEEEVSNQGSNTERAQSRENEEKKDDEKKPSKLKEMWGKLGLDMGTVMMMFKYVWPSHKDALGLFRFKGEFSPDNR